MLEIGQIVDGKYRILSKVGQGGMSIVYLALNERANKQWAIKEVRKDGQSDFETVKQGLVVETELLKKLHHPNLPSIVDVIDSEDTFLIVMDYIEGNSLSSALKEYGAQPEEYVIEWSKQLCDVLGYLHSRKPPIIYRDMKPSNVMLKPDGNVCLIDFGTAREYKSTSVEDTKCLGTQGYAAPEQYGGHGQTDARTDIYCLGATMYHLVTGHNPAKPPYEMYPIRHWNAGFSQGLEEVILKCTQKNPEDRYQDCAELMYALEHLREMDSSYKKSQKLKVCVFVASVLFSVMFLLLAGMFYSFESSGKKQNYSTYIDMAREQAEFDNSDKVNEYLKEAVSMNAAREDSYNIALDYFVSDTIFTAEESQNMMDLLSGNDYSMINSNDTYFKTNSDEYAKFCYYLGFSYYMLYTNDSNVTSMEECVGNRSTAARYFLYASEIYKSHLDNQEYMSEDGMDYQKLYDTSLHLSSLIKADENFEKVSISKDSEVDFYEVFNTMNDILEDDIVHSGNGAQKGYEILSLRICQKMEQRSNDWCAKFKNDGITEDQLRDLVNRTFAYADENIPHDDDYDKAFAGLKTERDAALENIAAVYSSTSTPKPERGEQ